MYMKDETMVEVVASLNLMIDDDEQGSLWEYHTDGNIQSVVFLGITMWNSEDDQSCPPMESGDQIKMVRHLLMVAVAGLARLEKTLVRSIERQE